MWSYSSCQVQGRGHNKNQIPCQDKTKTIFKNGVYVIALADGAGSAKLSHFGALCVVESVTELISENFDILFSMEDGRQVKKIIVEKLVSDIEIKAQELDCTPKDLASTMLVVAVSQDRYIIAHVGDGVIGYLDGVGLKVASAPSNGEYANETYFITSIDAISKMKLFKGNLNNIAGFVVMSDGTEQSLYNKKNNTLSPAIIKLMQRNIILDEHAMSSQLRTTFENVITTKTFDDCSIALLSRENKILHSFSQLNYKQKCELYMIKFHDKSAKKRTMRYDSIIELLQKPLTCCAVSNKIHLPPKYTKKHLEHLRVIGLIKFTNGFYYT